MDTKEIFVSSIIYIKDTLPVIYHSITNSSKLCGLKHNNHSITSHGFCGSGIQPGHSENSLYLVYDVWGLSWDLKTGSGWMAGGQNSPECPFIHMSGGCCHWLGPQLWVYLNYGYLKKLLLINSCGYFVSLEHNKWVLRTCFPRRTGRSPITMYDLDPEVTWLHFHHSHRSIQTLRRVSTSHNMKSIKDRRSYFCGQHGKYNAL